MHCHDAASSFRRAALLGTCASAACLVLLAPRAGATAAVHLAAGEQSVTILGEAEGDLLGSEVAIADLDQDGRADLIVSAPNMDVTFRGDQGAVLIFFSRATWPGTLDLGATAADVTIRGTARDEEVSLGGTGDVDGDGHADLVLRADGSGASGTLTQAGKLLVFPGRASWPADLTTSDAAATVHMARSGELGAITVARFDGDALADLVIGTGYEEVLVLLGRSVWPPIVDLAVTQPDVRFVNLGSDSVPVVGDVSGDRQPDLAFPTLSTTFSGVPVVFGRSPWPAVVDLNVTTPDVTIPARCPCRAVIAELSGDATHDFVIADSTAPVNGIPRTRVHAGGAGFGAPAITELIEGRGVFATRPFVADVDGDGARDLLRLRSGNGARNRVQNAGAIGVLRGPLPLGTVDLETLEEDLVVHGASAGDSLGSSVAVGDVDRDGRVDLVVSARLADAPGRADAGAAYVLLGPDFSPSLAPPDLFVDARSGDDARDGLSWATSLQSIRVALDELDSTVGPVTVRVAEGLHRETFLQLGSGISLVGGHRAGTGERGAGTAQTVIITSFDAALQLLPRFGDSPTRVDGFIVTGGLRTALGMFGVANGAGLDVSAGPAVIANTVVMGNRLLLTSTQGFTSCPFDPTQFVCEEACGGKGAGILIARGASVDLLNDLVYDNTVETTTTCLGGCPQSCFSGNFRTAIHADQPARLVVMNTTVTDNSATGLHLVTGDATTELVVQDDVLHGNFGDLQLTDPTLVARVSHDVVGTSNVPLDVTCTAADPLLVPGPAAYYLSQIAAGQAADSPAVDAGSGPSFAACPLPAPDPCMGQLSTRTDAVRDAGRLDMGYHHLFAPRRPPSFGGLRSVQASGDCRIVLSWDAGDDPDFDGPDRYFVFRSPTSGGQNFGTPVAILNAPTLTYADRPLVFGTTYYYVVRAVDALGLQDSNTIELSATTIDATPPVLTFGMSMTGPCTVRESTRSGSAPCSPIARMEFHRSTVPGFVPDASSLVAVDPPFPFVDTVSASGIYYYVRTLADAAGHFVVSPQVEIRVPACSGPVPVPGQPKITRATRAAGIDFTITPADGADFHRLYRGSLLLLQGGYDHGSSPGVDGVPGSPDDLGNCTFPGLAVSDARGLEPGSFYYLVSGVNTSGEGHLGLDSNGAASADVTTGLRDCP